MAKIVHRFELGNEKTVIKVPTGSTVLCAKMKNNVLDCWVMVDTKITSTVEKMIYVFVPGEEIPDNLILRYIDTAISNGGMVYHVFEEVPWSSK